MRFDLAHFSVQSPEVSAIVSSDVVVLATTSRSLKDHVALLSKISMSDRPVKLIFVSSTSVVLSGGGEANEGAELIDQSNPLAAIGAMVLSILPQRATVLRFSGLFGPGRHPANFYPTGAVIDHADLPVNMIHLDDCVQIIKTVIAQGIWGETFNCAADTHPTRREFFSAAAKEAGLTTPSFSSGGEKQGKVISNRKLLNALGMKLRYPDVIKALEHC